MSRPRIGERCGRIGEVHFISILVTVVIYVVVLDLCEDRPSCSVLASPGTFTQDPCSGTSKYLEVSYRCSPNEFEELTVCEGEEMDIGCHQGNRIAIFAAMFGRKPNGTTTCPPHKQGFINCQAKETISEVRNQCHSRKKCSLLANASVFGDPCPTGIHKYLTVSYACVPKKYLKQLHRKSGRRKKKKKKKRKKKRKKKKRKGLDKLLPDVISTTAKVIPETLFDNLFETYEKEEVTYPGSHPIDSEETSTADLVLNNILSSSESTEETSSFIISTSQNNSHSLSTESTIITTSNQDVNPQSTNNAMTDISSQEVLTDFSSQEVTTDFSSQETSSHSKISSSSDSDKVLDTQTQEPFPIDRRATTADPFLRRNEEKDKLSTSVSGSEVFSNNNVEEKITSQMTPQPTTEENISIETNIKNNSGGGDLTTVNLKSDSNVKDSESENSLEESDENDRKNSYGRVHENLSPERTSVSSNPTHFSQSPKEPDDININNQNSLPDDNQEIDNQKPVLVIERNLTVLCPNNSNIPTDIRWRGRERPRDVRSIGFLEDWFSTWHFLQTHEEKAWLYFTLGICFGIIVLLIIILIKLCINFKRSIRARLDVSEPTHRSAHINNHSSLDAPMLEHSDSMDRIEFVQFHPRGTLRSMRGSNSNNRDIVNYYG